jgi:hypothetical protein
MYAAAMSRLLRIWHVEVLSSVASRPGASTFTRTSYCIAPERWAQLPAAELQRRCEMLLEASYRQRNHQTAQSGDATEMWWIGYAFEWVAPHEMPIEPFAIGERVWLRASGVADALKFGALEAIEALLSAPRPGLDAKPWQDAFTAWAIDDGDNWKIAKYSERAAAFERLG